MDILDMLWEPHSWWETRHKVQMGRELNEFFSDEAPGNKLKHFDIVSFVGEWVVRYPDAMLYMRCDAIGFSTKFDFVGEAEHWLWSSRSNALILDDQVTELWQAEKAK